MNTATNSHKSEFIDDHDIIDNINSAIDWSAGNGMEIVKKLDEMLTYYEAKGCEVRTLAEYKQAG